MIHFRREGGYIRNGLNLGLDDTGGIVIIIRLGTRQLYIRRRSDYLLKRADLPRWVIDWRRDE